MVKIEPDKLISIFFAGVGSVLGIYNFFKAKNQSRRFDSTTFAISLMAMEKVLSKILAFPIRTADDLVGLSYSDAIESLNAVEEEAYAQQKDLCQLCPEFAPILIEICSRSNSLKVTLLDPQSPKQAIVANSKKFYDSSQALAAFRVHSRMIGLQLYDQSEPTPNNGYGDGTFKEISDRITSLAFSELSFATKNNQTLPSSGSPA